jgi:hypothetical protein
MKAFMLYMTIWMPWIEKGRIENLDGHLIAKGEEKGLLRVVRRTQSVPYCKIRPPVSTYPFWVMYSADNEIDLHPWTSEVDGMRSLDVAMAGLSRFEIKNGAYPDAWYREEPETRVFVGKLGTANDRLSNQRYLDPLQRLCGFQSTIGWNRNTNQSRTSSLKTRKVS